MKKIFYLLPVFTILMFTSCFEDKDNWYTKTAMLDGRYVVATTCEEYSSDNTTIKDGKEVSIYNSASNVSDEIWIDTQVASQAIKGKFKISGNPTDFKGVDTETKNISSNTFLFVTDKGYVVYAKTLRATAAGLSNDGIQLYSRITLVEGKVIPKGATTIGGNVSDSVYIKTVVHSDYVKFTSYLLPKEEWKDANVPEFGWVLKAGSNTPADPVAWDETWTLAGYRYTGYPEDTGH